MIDELARHGALMGSDGKRWPKPTLVSLAVGDAVLVHRESTGSIPGPPLVLVARDRILPVPLYADGVPHSSSFNRGPEPRIQVYFRLVRTDRPAGCEKSHPAAQMDNWLVHSQSLTPEPWLSAGVSSSVLGVSLGAAGDVRFD